ncbi:hypothetical protein TrST_g10446 [Triparma strigata]|uniref:JmjC domain-containing protein n=1 Tax=Triparma strigata TaxID=1606541 RepID=A0A9W7CBY6_9STRA|nr:hypothetical protein TrST_g10446 [Triparma strigata]
MKKRVGNGWRNKRMLPGHQQVAILTLLVGVICVWVECSRLVTPYGNLLHEDSFILLGNSPKGVHPHYGAVKVVDKIEDVTLEVSKNHPFVLRNLVNRWQGFNDSVFNLDGFAGEFGDITTMTQENNYPTVQLSDRGKERSLQELNKIVRCPAATREPPSIYGAASLSLEQRNKLWGNLYLPPTLQDDVFIECLGRKLADEFLSSFFWTQIFVGVEGTGMEMHKDTIRTHVWTAQLEGEKQAVFCPPGSKKIEAFGETLSTDGSNSCLWAALQPGELLFWPSNWLHQTLNSIGPSVALSGMAVPDGELAKEFLNTIKGHPRMSKALRKKVYQCTSKT